MRQQRIHYSLDTGGVIVLPEEDVIKILRAADPLVMSGGRSMLSKILKGSKDKKLLAHNLEQCPAYGYYHQLTLEEIGHRVDWMITAGYLRIEYNDRLPMLVFTDVGWAIERETYAEELYQAIHASLVEGESYPVEMLKDRNREIILLLIDKIKEKGDASFIPFLQRWQTIDYKKVRAAIQEVIDRLTNNT